MIWGGVMKIMKRFGTECGVPMNMKKGTKKTWERYTNYYLVILYVVAVVLILILLHFS